MTDNELLLAISGMIDPLREDVQSMKQDIQNVKEELQGVKQDVQNVKEELQGIKQDNQNMKQELQGVKQNIQKVEQDIQEIKTRVKKIEIVQENEVLPRLNTIESCYTSTYDRYKSSVEGYETLKQDMSIVKRVVMEHSEKLQKIG